jgi:hypothetical protein
VGMKAFHTVGIGGRVQLTHEFTKTPPFGFRPFSQLPSPGQASRLRS